MPWAKFLVSRKILWAAFCLASGCGVAVELFVRVKGCKYIIVPLKRELTLEATGEVPCRTKDLVDAVGTVTGGVVARPTRSATSLESTVSPKTGLRGSSSERAAAANEPMRSAS